MRSWVAEIGGMEVGVMLEDDGELAVMIRHHPSDMWSPPETARQVQT